MNKFKTFFTKETGKEIKTKDKTVVEILVKIAGEIYSQNQTIPNDGQEDQQNQKTVQKILIINLIYIKNRYHS